MALSVHQHCMDLQSMLLAAATVAVEVGVVMNYASAKAELKEREDKGRGEAVAVWDACERRMTRWNLTIRLNQFEGDVDKVLYIIG